MVARGRGAQRHRAAYNNYVLHDRQEKYYERKKTLSKFKRMQKYEQQQEHSLGDTHTSFRSTLERALAEGPEAFEAEYEKRLSLSFGSEGPAEGTGATQRLKKKRKRKQTAPEAEEPAGVAASREERPAKKRRPRAVPLERNDSAGQLPVHKGSPEQAPADEKRKEAPASSNATGGEALPGGRAGAKQPPAESRRKPAAPAKGGTGAGRAVSTSAAGGDYKNGWTSQVPTRYSKELRGYREEQAAKEAERQRIANEVRERNQRRREHNRGRALKARQLAQRNSRGQPRMQGVLEAMAAKLSQQVGAGRAGGRS